MRYGGVEEEELAMGKRAAPSPADGWHWPSPSPPAQAVSESRDALFYDGHRDRLIFFYSLQYDVCLLPR